MVEARLRVIYGDTDQMGVVYYANYFRYFEFARGEFLRAHDLAYRDIEREGALLPVTEASCSYKASARYDDMVLVRAELTELRRASLRFEYALSREADGQRLCTGFTVHACVGRDGKPRRIPGLLAARLKPKQPNQGG